MVKRSAVHGGMSHLLFLSDIPGLFENVPVQVMLISHLREKSKLLHYAQHLALLQYSFGLRFTLNTFLGSRLSLSTDSAVLQQHQANVVCKNTPVFSNLDPKPLSPKQT